MRGLLKSISILAGLAIAMVLAVFLYIQNANSLKPELEALISDEIGMSVSLRGDVSWQLLPPIRLSMQDVVAVDDDQVIEIEQLTLAIDLKAIWQDTDRWRIDALHLSNAVRSQGDAKLQINALDLNEFELAKPANLSFEGVYSQAENAPLPFSIDGTLTYAPALDEKGLDEKVAQLTFADTQITTDMSKGTCDLDIRESSTMPASLPASSDTDLLPLAVLSSYEVIGDCSWDALTYEGETFKNVETKLTNVAPSLNLYIEAPEFFSGSLITEVQVDFGQLPIRWTILPELTDVDSEQFLQWSNRNVEWAALVAMHSEATFRGNSMEQLYRTISADSHLDGGQGQINIAALKKQLASVALLTRRSDSVDAWPDVWAYEELTGSWQTRGQNQSFDLVLDHLAISGEGEVDYSTNVVEMLAHVTLGQAPEGSPYKVNPILQDTPLPFRCRGAANDVKCKLDKGATKQLVARALSGDDDTGLRRKLEQKIDDEVPEEYRETARSLLDILGRALEDN